MRDWLYALVVSVVTAGGCAAAGIVIVARSPGGAVRMDRDGDGFAGAWVCPTDVSGCDAEVMNKQPIADLDCDDNDKARHPGAYDPPGDGIDQNCDGADGVVSKTVPDRLLN